MPLSASKPLCAECHTDVSDGPPPYITDGRRLCSTCYFGDNIGCANGKGECTVAGCPNETPNYGIGPLNFLISPQQVYNNYLHVQMPNVENVNHHWNRLAQRWDDANG